MQKKNNECVVLRLCFPLMGGYEAELLEKEITMLFSQGVKDLSIDLSLLEGLNGYGILLLLKTHEITQTVECSFRILNPSPMIRDTLRKFKSGATLPIQYVKGIYKEAG